MTKTAQIRPTSCQKCGNPIDSTSKVGRVRLFCSPACRVAAHKTRAIAPAKVPARTRAAAPATSEEAPKMKRGPGRPPKAPVLMTTGKRYDDSLEFLREVMNNEELDVEQRTRAAITISQYTHTKRADGGKKEEAAQAAKRAAAGGTFIPMPPPKLAVVK